MSESSTDPPPEDVAAFIARETGHALSDDARTLLRIAIDIGLARANERDTTPTSCASWINLVGAALLASDPTSRWLQEKRASFDSDEILPSLSAQLQSLRPTPDPTDVPANPPLVVSLPFFSTSAIQQLKVAALIVASQVDGTIPGILDSVHIISSLILDPTGDHGNEPTIGHGDSKKRDDILAHMAQWVADNAGAFNLGIDTTSSFFSYFTSSIGTAHAIFAQLRPELALAAGIEPNESAQDWESNFPKWAPPYKTDRSNFSWCASGPLGRVLEWSSHAAANTTPVPEWTPLIALLTEAVGRPINAILPGEGSPYAGRGLSLLARAAALATRVSRDPTKSPTLDLHHLVGAVFAPAEAVLPPAFEPFPPFRPDIRPRARQVLRRRFLVLVKQYGAEVERLSVWADVILGDRLSTARIPTDIEPDEDLLGFTRYATAFASVIADRAVLAPLAIGLFGVWGSGKSAMIDMINRALEDIDDRAGFNQEERFWRGIVRITFNAWHYAETNLWASLFVRILEELANHLRVDTPVTPQAERDRLQAELEKAKKDQQEADGAFAEARVARDAATAEAAKFTQELAAAREAEQAVAEAQEAEAKAARKAEETGIHALQIAGDAVALLSAFGLPTAAELGGADAEQLEAELRKKQAEVSELADSFKGIWGPFRKLKLILGWEQPARLRLILAAALALLIVLFVWVAVQRDWVKTFAASALSIVMIVTPVLAPLLARASRDIKRAPDILERLSKAADKVKERGKERADAAARVAAAASAPERKLAQDRTVEAAAKAMSKVDEANAADAAVATAQAKLDAAQQAVAAANVRVADMVPDRLLGRFVDDRSKSEDYLRQLGLPTRIRQDIDTLRAHLADLAKAETAGRRADRIVLFIDDLDRCAPDVVVKVLEAVHILLASDLFVVVVGVDVRWLTRALATHHASQFGNREVLIPEDFLEKIFQVPFWIPSMSLDGRQAVVRNALPEIGKFEPAGSGPGPGAEASGQTPETSRAPVGPESASAHTPGDDAAPLPTLEPVELTSKEHAALLRWGAFAGDTPRRLKRFARSYLILRASLLPTQREAFLANSEFDTVTRLMAFNTADPAHWLSFSGYIRSAKTADWSQADLGVIGEQIFGIKAAPPPPASCLPWLEEVERFGFAAWAQAAQT